MTTSNDDPGTPERQPLRLRMTGLPGRQTIDGGWWPQSRVLADELADLVDHFPEDRGRIVRVVYSGPDWEDSLQRVPTARGYVRCGSVPHDDTHVVMLTTSERLELCVLVVPPDMTEKQGEAALAAAVTPGYATSPKALLAAVREQLPAPETAPAE